jgi:hypothetical protein
MSDLTLCFMSITVTPHICELKGDARHADLVDAAPAPSAGILLT